MIVTASRASLLARLPHRPSAPDGLETRLLLHATVCLTRSAFAAERRSGAWSPYIQPSTLHSGWFVLPLLADVDEVAPGECAEAAVLGVPEEPVPMAWAGRGETFRLVERGAEVGKGVVLGVHWPAG